MEEELELEDGKFVKFHWRIDTNGKKYSSLTQHFKKDKNGQPVYDGKVEFFYGSGGSLTERYTYKMGISKGLSKVYVTEHPILKFYF